MDLRVWVSRYDGVTSRNDARKTLVRHSINTLPLPDDNLNRYYTIFNASLVRITTMTILSSQDGCVQSGLILISTRIMGLEPV